MSEPERGNRVRVPPPLLRWRLPSGRGAIEQPNATGDGDAALTARFWLAVALTGVAAGLLGDLLMYELTSVEHLAFGYQRGPFLSGVEAASAIRRVVVLLIAGAIGGPAWFLLRRRTAGERAEVDDSIWRASGELSVRRSLGTSILSEIVIGMGASIGREAAPKLMGGVAGRVVSDRLTLTAAQRKLLVACGAGAGLAAVYNVPLGGALFTAEILVGSITLPVALPALACSAVATAVAWLYLPDQATYLDIPSYGLTGTLLAWSVPAGLVIGVLAAGYVRLIGTVSYHRARGRWVLVAPVGVFGVLGLLAISYPQLLGNGKGMAHAVFLGSGGLGLLLALAVLKPIVSVACLGSGASGGLFTPTLSTGAVLGGLLGLAWTHLWPGSPVGAFALVGAAAMLGAAMQAPLAALALVLELTHNDFRLMVAMIVATVAATTVTRTIDGYSIYSARLERIPPVG